MRLTFIPGLGYIISNSDTISIRLTHIDSKSYTGYAGIEILKPDSAVLIKHIPEDSEEILISGSNANNENETLISRIFVFRTDIKSFESFDAINTDLHGEGEKPSSNGDETHPPIPPP